MPWAEIREVLGSIRAVCRVEPMSLETHDRSFALSERYGFSIYDSMILASALTWIYMVGGLALSYKPNLPAGATIIVVAGIVYLLVLVVRPSRRRFQTPRK